MDAGKSFLCIFTLNSSLHIIINIHTFIIAYTSRLVNFLLVQNEYYLETVFYMLYLWQVLFLMYHYFAATEIYNAIRVFIAAYVWMTGFGNFSYYYIRKDFSIARFAQVNF